MKEQTSRGRFTWMRHVQTSLLNSAESFSLGFSFPMLLDSPPQRCATYSELPLLNQTCAEVRKRKARILIKTAKKKLKALVVNFRSGSPTIFLGRNATGLTKSSEEIANKA